MPGKFHNPPYFVEQVYRPSDLREVVDWGLLLYGVPEIHKKTKGEGQQIAILDTGCQLDHPDLKDQIVDAKDFTNSPFGPHDKVGHGTHCAGIAAAAENNVGCIGVAPKARLWIGKVLGDDGAGVGRWIAMGIRAAFAAGNRIISMSLGSATNDPEIAEAIAECAAKGALFVIAAGNDGQRTRHINFPGGLPRVAGVASVDRYGRISNYSSSGPEVDVSAPGQDILSCYPTSEYAKLSGTSMATPFVAGVVALALAGGAAINSIEDLLLFFKSTARDTGAPGHDNSYGWGLINPEGMLPPQEPPRNAPEKVLAETVTIDGVEGSIVFRSKE